MPKSTVFCSDKNGVFQPFYTCTYPSHSLMISSTYSAERMWCANE